MTFDRQTLAAAAIALAGCLASSTASAHFILDEPKSMMEQDVLGDPQKATPCGPDAMPTTPVGEFTEVRAGDMLHVSWSVTIPHGGHYRIALDKDPSKFVDPPFTDPVACTYDLASVPKGAHDNVLMDGINANATSQDVKLPDEPCDDCTLQVIMVMQNHGPPNCIYYHCARLKIMPKDGSTGTPDAGMPMGEAGSTAGAGGAAGGSMMGTGGSTTMTGGMGGGGGAGGSTPGMAMPGQGMMPPGTTGTPPATGMPIGMATNGVTGTGGMPPAAVMDTSSEESGCTVAAGSGSGSGFAATWSSLGLALTFLAVRRRRLRTR